MPSQHTQDGWKTDEAKSMVGSDLSIEAVKLSDSPSKEEDGSPGPHSRGVHNRLLLLIDSTTSAGAFWLHFEECF